MHTHGGQEPSGGLAFLCDFIFKSEHRQCITHSRSLLWLPRLANHLLPQVVGVEAAALVPTTDEGGAAVVADYANDCGGRRPTANRWKTFFIATYSQIATRHVKTAHTRTHVTVGG